MGCSESRSQEDQIYLDRLKAALENDKSLSQTLDKAEQLFIQNSKQNHIERGEYVTVVNKINKELGFPEQEAEFYETILDGIQLREKVKISSPDFKLTYQEVISKLLRFQQHKFEGESWFGCM